ncbi:MAG: hypothetical protein O8C55_03970 [Candidatus Methanoperedens sp.]|nr:hypothetical protein [Candidatus Methanoperedens sp.]
MKRMECSSLKKRSDSRVFSGNHALSRIEGTGSPGAYRLSAD